MPRAFLLPTQQPSPGYLFGVRTDAKTGKIISANIVHLTYPIPGTEKFTAEDVAKAFEQSLASYLHTKTSHGGLKLSLFGLHILKHELSKNTFYTLPFISVTIVLILVFTVSSCMTADIVTSKPLEGCLGVFSSSLAIVSAGGLMFLCGVPFITQVAVMPFIALAIGVDDTYIILGAWQRTDRGLKPHRRLALALRESGSAITVTSLTDCLSFGIGSFSLTPAIAIFCQYTAAAIFFDFLYQITFFAAVVVLGGQREAEGRHCIFVWQHVDPKTVHRALTRGFSCPAQRFFQTYYSRFLCLPAVRSAVILIYFTYLALAIYGCTRLKCNLTPSNLLVDDSPLRHYIELAENHMWSEGLVGRVYVNRAPDFSKGPSTVNHFLRFVDELENTKYSIGKNSTQIWLRNFLNYWQYFVMNQANFYTDLQDYVRLNAHKTWNSYLRWGKRQVVGGGVIRVENYVSKFYFTTGFQIKDWNHRTGLLLAWRNVTARFPELEAVVYDENNFYTDQVLALGQTTMQAMGVALLFMFLVCFCFIAHRHVVYWVTFSLLSMDIGIIGFLALWGSDLSPTTILNILMSVGLSVDFATHVGYRIYRSPIRGDADERLAEALGAIAWPVLQGGLSTFFAVFGLQFVKSYVVRVFFRTNLLVVTLGLFHGLLVLPVVLRTLAIPNSTRQRDRVRRTSENLVHSGHLWTEKKLERKESDSVLNLRL